MKTARLSKVVFTLFLLLSIAVTISPISSQSLNYYPKRGFDLGNTYWNPNETTLNVTNVNTVHFGKLWRHALDGQAYAEPLYAANIAIPGKGTHNVVYVCTEHNSVYAFDADSAAPPNNVPLWQVNFGASIPSGQVFSGDISPEYGITATPVIDPATNTIYIEAKTLENGFQVHRIHGLDLGSGQERADWGKAIIGGHRIFVGRYSYTIPFNPYIQHARSSLTISANHLYVTFASHGDNFIGQYHGWVFAYSLSNPKLPPTAWSTSPDYVNNGETAGGIWMTGSPPAVDSWNNLYFITGNGPLNADIGGRNLGDSVVRLQTWGGATLSYGRNPSEFFSPNNQNFLDLIDADFGSGGIMAPPPHLGSKTPNLLIGGGKDGILRLINRDNMGGFSARYLPGSPDKNLLNIPGIGDGIFSSPAYWGSSAGSYVYIDGLNGPVVRCVLGLNFSGNSTLSTAEMTPQNTSYPSCTPTISSNGGLLSSGVMWTLNSATGALHAYSASNVSLELYNSNMNFGADGLDALTKFSVPTVANGKVYVGTQGSIFAFGPH